MVSYCLTFFPRGLLHFRAACRSYDPCPLRMLNWILVVGGIEHADHTASSPPKIQGGPSRTMSVSSSSASFSGQLFSSAQVASRMSILQTEPSQTINNPLVFDYIHSQQSNFEKAADTLLKVSGLVFRVYSSEQQQDIFRHVYRGSERPSSKAAVCELCSLAAVGTQFSGGRIPPNDGDIMYSMAKQFLDDVIAVSPLRALKVVTLLAVYNIVNHATVSLAYIGKPCRSYLLGSLDQY